MFEKLFNKPKTPEISTEEAAWIKREFNTDNIAEVEEILKNRVASGDLTVETLQD